MSSRRSLKRARYENDYTAAVLRGIEEGVRNNVGSLKIRRPPLQDESNIEVKRWLLKSRKSRANPATHVYMEDVNAIMRQIEALFPALQKKLETRAFTAGIHPSDAKFLEDLHAEYRAYQKIKRDYEAAASSR
jgi:hypothetical protein